MKSDFTLSQLTEPECSGSVLPFFTDNTRQPGNTALQLVKNLLFAFMALLFMQGMAWGATEVTVLDFRGNSGSSCNGDNTYASNSGSMQWTTTVPAGAIINSISYDIIYGRSGSWTRMSFSLNSSSTFSKSWYNSDCNTETFFASNPNDFNDLGESSGVNTLSFTADNGTPWVYRVTVTVDYTALTPCGTSGPVTLPWTEGFESAELLTISSNIAQINGICDWGYEKTSNGRLRFDAYSHTGSRGAAFDASPTGTISENYLIATLNLSNYSGATDLELSFWHRNYGEEDHNNDRVWIRGSNSDSWIEIYDLFDDDNNSDWVHVVDLDIDAAISGAGQSITSTFQIRFGQEDDYSLTNDGRVFDDIQITGTLPCDVTAFVVTGGGGYCDNGGTGLSVNLSDSETGVTYKLYLNGSPTGITLPGTNSEISFDDLTTVGTYTIIGTDDVDDCDVAMNGSAIITVTTPPTTAGVTIDQGDTSQDLTGLGCPSGGSSSEGANNAGVGESTGSGAEWSDPGNITEAGSPYATAGVGGAAGDRSQYLKASDFGFNIPSGSTIDGIVVVINRMVNNTSGDRIDDVVRLVDETGTLVGDNNAYTSSNWPGSFDTRTYGANNDNWNAGLSADDINDSDFGVVVSVYCSSGSERTFTIDYIQITVYYTTPSGTLDWYTASSGGTAIGSGTSFDPVGVTGSGITDTNTPGIWTFYAECSNNPGCRSAADYVINLVCANPSDGGVIAGDQTICSGDDPVAFTSSSGASGETGTLEYKWQSSTTSASADFTDNGATGLTYDVPAGLAQTTWYKRLARVDCSADWSGAAESNVVEVTVNDVSAGVIAKGGVQPGPDCGTLNPGITAITTAASGSGALSYSWVQSTDGTNWVPALGNPDTEGDQFNPDEISVTTSFKRIVTSTLNSVTCSAESNVLEYIVNPIPDVEAITGSPTDICVGSTVQLSCATPGGVWSSDDNNIATIDATGLVTGISAGTLNLGIHYTVTNEFGCSKTVNKSVTVLALPTVSCPSDFSEASCNFVNQAELDDAFADWLATASATNGTLSDNNTGAPDICGGSTTVTFTSTSTTGCGSVSCEATFEITDAPELVASAPAAVVLDACTTAADIQTAYDAWKLGFSVDGGCSPTDNMAGFPELTDLTCGGSLSFTLIADNIAGACVDHSEASSSFTVTPAADLVASAPAAVVLDACTTAADIQTAYDAWKLGFSVDGGCSPTDNMASFPELTDLTCGGSLSFTLVADNIAGACVDHSEASSSFTVTPAADLVASAPAAVVLDACTTAADIQTAYDAWKLGFSVDGGCSPTDNMAGFPALTDLTCGGQLSFTLIADNIAGACVDHSEASSSFTVTPMLPTWLLLLRLIRTFRHALLLLIFLLLTIHDHRYRLQPDQ